MVHPPRGSEELPGFVPPLHPWPFPEPGMSQLRVVAVQGEGLSAWHWLGVPAAVPPSSCPPSWPRARRHAAVLSDKHGLSWEAAAEPGN